MSARQQGRELQLETGIVPLIGEQACEQVVHSEQEPSAFEHVQDGAVLVHSNGMDLRSLDHFCGLARADL